MPAVEVLRRVWVQNYQCSEGKLGWCSSENIPPAGLYISSSYDLDAHYSKKRTTSWVGFKVHLTEICEKDSPHLITHVETTTAPVSDDARTAAIHEGFKQKELLPEQHIVDTGYVDAQLLYNSQQDYDIDLVGPTRPDVKWQAQQAACPEGHTSISWTPAIDNRKNEVIKIKFSIRVLSKLSQSCIVYSLYALPAPHHHGASGATASSVTTGTSACQNRGVQNALCLLRWGGRHHFARSPGDGVTPFPLHRSRKDASSAPGYRCCHECSSVDALARWRAPCSNQMLAFRSITSPGRLIALEGFASGIDFVSEPIFVSLLREGFIPSPREPF